jgi:HD-GYP domain-containing protein (c-di-GMP phosphodiesterase class II)
MTGYADVLPLREGGEAVDRLRRLAARLREAPLGKDARDLFAAAGEALADLSEEPVCADRVMCLLLVSRYVFYSGNAYAALEPAGQALAMAQRIGDTTLLAKAYKTLGNLYLETGSYPDTVSAFSAALQAAHEAREHLQEVEILTNLGLAHQYAGQFDDAVLCYERAVEMAEFAQVAPVARSAALGNMALARLQLREFPLARELAQRAVDGLEHPVGDYERTIRSMAECYYVRVLLEVGEVGLARERAEAARVHAHDTAELAHLFVDMAQGLVEVHDPATRDIGLSRLQAAVNASRKGAPSALRDALAMTVRGYEIAGQPNTALVYLHEVAQFNGDSRVRNVLAHHRLHLNRVQRQLAERAREVIVQHREELRFQRVSMDVLHECLLVLEKNTVAAELHDDDTGEHCYRVGALAKELARRQGMDDEMCTLIDFSARLHDIGKLHVPDSVLLKPGRLDTGERRIMQEHCQHGWKLIGQGGLAQLFIAQEIALNHHERWDGTGYPNGRSGNLIPLAARITALADVYDALTHRRCYKEAWTVEDALREIAALRGRHFDPELTDVFLQLVPELRAQHADLDAYLGAEARKNDFITDRARVARELKQGLGTYDAGAR